MKSSSTSSNPRFVRFCGLSGAIYNARFIVAMMTKLTKSRPSLLKDGRPGHCYKTPDVNFDRMMSLQYDVELAISYVLRDLLQRIITISWRIPWIPPIHR